MKIRILEMEGANVLTYEKFKVDFVKATVSQLIGANGSGKSSLPVILEETLWNKNSRGIQKADLNHRYSGIKGWNSRVKFEVEDDVYEIVKTVKASAKVKLSKNGEDISGHTATQTYTKIKEIFGNIEFTTFSKLVYQSMVSSMDFLTATDANRKKFLISLLGLEKYATIEEQFKKVRKEAKSELDKIQGSVKTINAFIRKNKEIDPPKSEVTVPEFDTSLDDSLERAVQDKAEAQAFNSNIAEKQDAKRKANQAIRNYQNAVAKQQQSEKNLPAPVEHDSEELLRVTREHSKVAAEMAGHKKTYQKFKAEADQTECPTCGHHLDKTEQAAARDKAKDAFIALKPERDTLAAKLEELSQSDKLSKQYEKAYNEFKQLDAKVQGLRPSFEEASQVDLDENLEELDLRSLTREVENARKEIALARSAIDEAIEFNSGVAAHNAKVETLSKQLQENVQQLSELESTLAGLEEAVNDYDILCKAFGSKGLVSYKIESNVKVFEELINKYLSVFTGGEFVLGFELDSTKLKVAVLKSGMPASIKSLSSGEMAKVNISTLLAIRNLMTAVSDVQINLLFLDEVISVLDTESRDLLVDILLEEHHLNSFLVSHGYSHPLTQSYLVTKKDNLSTISEA